MNSVIYFRQSIDFMEEIDLARKYFNVYDSRVLLPKNSLVIPRYSALPFYEELENDVKLFGSWLINSYEQHRIIADFRNYYPLIEDLTPKSYFMWESLPEGQYVVKGITNSRKHEWNRRMFVPSIKELPNIVNSLLDDDLIKDQGLVVREYVPLRKLGEGINGLPISNEWRFFILNDSPFIWDYYWASEPETKPYQRNEIPVECLNLISKVTKRMYGKIPFYVIDVAETDRGNWIVIELNDGQMSGLSMIDSDLFYCTLKDRLEEYYG